MPGRLMFVSIPYRQTERTSAIPASAVELTRRSTPFCVPIEPCMSATFYAPQLM
jgi:hypothetical protein